MPKQMIRPLSSWLALLDRLHAPDAEQPFIQRMRDKLREGYAPTDAEAERMERLDGQYGFDAGWVGLV